MRPLLTVSLMAVQLTVTAALAAGSSKLEVTAAWLRATPPGASVGAGYFTLHNAGSKDLKLMSVQTKLAGSAEIHQSFMRNGEEEMREVDGGLPVKAGQTVKLEPGSYHLMLMGLDHPLAAGTSEKLTLMLDDGTNIEVNAPVRDEAP